MINKKKAAMEMSIGTMVTIVLLMTVLILGLILIRGIFRGATDSVDAINDQVRSEIENLFNTEDKELVVSLGTKHTASVKQGTKDFGFVFGFAPEDPTALMNGNCWYNVDVVRPVGGDYCIHLSGWTVSKIEDWFITGHTRVKFSEIQRNVGYELIRLRMPENIPVCIQRFNIEVECQDGYSGQTYFDINIIKKGMF